MKRPMIYWVILFVLGEVLGYQFIISQLVIGIAGMAGFFTAIAAFYKFIIRRHIKKHRILMDKRNWIWWAGGIFFLFGIVSMLHMKEKICFCEQFKDTRVYVEGVIQKRIEKEKVIQYVISANAINGKNCSLNVLTSIKNADVIPGDYIGIMGTSVGFNHAANPGEYDEESYQYGNGILLKIENARIKRQSGKMVSIKAFLFYLQKRLDGVYQKLFDEENASLADAMVLGDKTNLDSDIKELYRQNGIAHLIAISGLHIAMIGGTIYQFLRRKSGSFGMAAILGGGFIILYGMMTGLSGSTLRAVIMLLVMIGAEVTGRRYDILSAIALALLVMLIRNPYQMFQAGFLLSFGAVLGITWLVPVWNIYFEKLPRWLSGLGVSISVQIITLPVMLWFFYEIPVWGFLLNLIVVPLMSILLACLIFCGLTGVFSLAAGRLFAIPAVWVFKLYKVLCEGSGYLPFHTFCMGRPSVMFIVIYYVLLGMFLLSQCGGMKNGSRKKYGMWCYVISFMILFVVQKIPGNLKICMMDVGQGDGFYIRTPENVHILMDGGSSTKDRLGQYVLDKTVRYFGTRKLDYVFVSHSDKDHYSGILELLQNGDIQIEYLVLPAISNPDEAYRLLEQKAKECQTEVIYMETGSRLQIGEVSLECLNPEHRDYTDKNTASLVFLLTFKDFDMLFTSDIDCIAEERLLKQKQFEQYNIEVLKVAHHGSATSSSDKFLKIVDPEVSLVSVAEKNGYGHPAEEVMRRLLQYSDKIYLTKDCGAVTIDTNGRWYRLKTYLPVSDH